MRLAAAGRNSDAQLAAQITAGERVRILQHRVAGAGKDQFAAVFARAGTQIQHVIGGQDGVGIVFHHQQRIAEIAQALQDFNQAMRIARMQADRRLIQHVERAHQMGAQRSSQLDALRFAAGKCGGEPVEREVIEADFIKKAQALLNFFQDFFGDGGFGCGQLQRVKEGPRFLHRHLADFGDRASRDFHGASFGAQPRAAAVRACGVAAVAAEENAHVQLVFLALEPPEEAFHAGKIFLLVAVENGGRAARR